MHGASLVSCDPQKSPDTPGSPEGNTEGPGTASSEPLLQSGVLGFPSRRGLTPRGSLECNPEIPAFPGEEY